MPNCGCDRRSVKNIKLNCDSAILYDNEKKLNEDIMPYLVVSLKLGCTSALTLEESWFKNLLHLAVLRVGQAWSNFATL